MNNQSKITCPKCGTEIDVQNVLTHQIEEEAQRKFNAQLAEANKTIEKQNEALAKEKADFELKKQKENELFQERLDQKIKEQSKLIETNMKARLEAEQADQFKELQAELNDKLEKLKELNKSRAEIARLNREKDELADRIKAEAQETLNAELTKAKETIQKTEQNKNEMALELRQQLDAQKKLTEEMRRKQEQGSMQLQGEVQELAIEEWLADKFPLDSISEIKKGARGADCLQTVNTRAKQNCGTIYYESKRTKDFHAPWIEKFKNDMRDKNADVGILVTEAMPKDMDRMGLKDGIWICSFDEFKGLCFVLRESIIQISNAIVSQENKGDKMVMLYDFLTSNEFRLQIEGIVEGFKQMRADLDTEKTSIMGHWKKREKQIEKVVLNTTFMYNSFKGIAGNAVQTVQALEMPINELDEAINTPKLYPNI